MALTDNRIMRVGIAGYGTVGRIRHRFIDTHPNMKVVAVSDRGFGSGAIQPVSGVHCEADYHILMEQALDVLFVCLPNNFAPDATIAGLEHGFHVFCEKPPGRNVEDIQRVIASEKKHPGQKLMYGFNHRYHDSVREALRIIRSKELGEIIDLRGIYGKSKIISFASDWRTKRSIAGGGILLDQGIHMVDMMRLFAGEFTEIYSFVSNAFWQHDVEDNAYALMRTKEGCVAMLQSSATQWRHRFQLDITLRKGAIVLSGILSNTRSYAPETLTVIYAGDEDCGDPKEQMTRFNADNSWRDEIFDFASSVLLDKPIEFGSSLDALRTMELVYGIYLADREWSQRFNLVKSQTVTVP